MSFTSLSFLLLVALTLLAYYLLPKRCQWVVLLTASYVFYLCGGVKLIVYLLFTTAVTYLAGLRLARLNEQSKHDRKKGDALRRRKRLVVLLTAVCCFGLLFVLKYWDDTAGAINRLTGTALPVLNLLIPLGVSYYIFQSFGYVIDIYRGKQKPEKNPLRYALFVSFFPQVVQGPISRYAELYPQLMQPHTLDFDRLRDGLLLAGWGYFKKLVIADRAGVLVAAVFGDYLSYDGAITAAGVFFYCIQLYCDFSGGIDITRGVAQMFGIDLAENFRRPLFATSLADYWRRWHISLGQWMRNYVFYPLSLSKPLGRLGKWARKRLRGKAGKILAPSVATFVVYFIIGIWHGANFRYILFGFWNGSLITLSLLLEPYYAQWKQALRIPDKSRLYHVFQMLRTSVLVFIGRYITRAPRFLAALSMLKRTVLQFRPASLFDGSLLRLGLSSYDLLVLAVAVLIVQIIEYMQERGIAIRSGLAAKSALVQWLAATALLLSILIFGIWGKDFVSAGFIYVQF